MGSGAQADIDDEKWSAFRLSSCADRPRAPSGGVRSRLGPATQSLISQMTAPVVTVAPTSACEAGDGAGLVGVERLLHLHRLEHDDEVALGDLLALLDGDLDDGALHRGGDGVAARRRRRPSCRGRASGFLAPRRRRRRRRPPSPAGSDDLEPLAADLDDDASARSPASSASAASPAYGAIWLSNSVSIQRVWTPNGRRRRPTNAGSATTARWNGMTVGMPSTTNSSSARRERSRAWVRSRPVTMSLAMQRVERAGDDLAVRRTPPSSADAGAGRRRASAVRVPGAGMKLRPRVLAVDAELDRVAADLRVVVAELLAGGDAEHLADQVDAGDLLGDAGARPAGGC